MSLDHSPSAHTQPGSAESNRAWLASSRRDVMDLAWAVECVTVEDETFVAAHIVMNNLMLVSPWWWRVLFWLMKRSRNPFGVLSHFYTSQPEEARHLLTETARHIRHGKDREEASSVGGFSQREVNIMTTILKARTAVEGPSVGTSNASEPNTPANGDSQ